MKINKARQTNYFVVKFAPSGKKDFLFLPKSEEKFSKILKIFHSLHYIFLLVSLINVLILEDVYRKLV